MKKLLLLLLLPLSVLGQELSVPVKFMYNFKPGPELYFAADNFGSFYSIKDNELKKHVEGETRKYRNLSLGDIYKVDLQNPLQVVVFYRKFNTAVLLDNQMNETRRINFSDIPEPVIAEAVGLASQNRLWLYNINTQQLGLYDLARNSFKSLTPPFTDTVTYYQSDYNYFYWIDVTGKCFASNLFGKVSFLGLAPGYDKAQFATTENLIIREGDALYLHSLKDGAQKRLEIAEKTFTGFYYAAQILSIFTDSEINQYKITIP